MVYSFKHAHSVEEQLRTIASHQIDAALKALSVSGIAQPEAVHEVRKNCKKLRGLIRLVRPSFPSYRTENRAFRKAARLFADLRDAKVMHDTCDLLTEACESEIERAELLAVRRAMAIRSTDLLAHADWECRKKRAKHLLKRARKRTREWTLTDQGWNALHGGIALTYDRAREAMRTVREEPSGPNIHEWRKQAKYHEYHTGLLRQVKPGLLKARAALLHELSEELGKHHDIHVFMTALESNHAAIADAHSIPAVRVVADRLGASIASRALRLGTQLFADETDTVLRRWAGWWSAWEEAERKTFAGSQARDHRLQ